MSSCINNLKQGCSFDAGVRNRGHLISENSKHHLVFRFQNYILESMFATSLCIMGNYKKGFSCRIKFYLQASNVLFLSENTKITIILWFRENILKIFQADIPLNIERIFFYNSSICQS